MTKRKLKPKRRQKRAKRYGAAAATYHVPHTYKRLIRPRVVIEDDDGSRWFVVTTRPQRERKAVKQLERAGIGIYLPTEAVEVYRDGRPWACRLHAAVSRFIFVRLSLDQIQTKGVAASLLACDEVHGIVTLQERPVVIPPAELQRFADALTGFGLEPEPVETPLQPGEVATVTGGPFTTFTAVIEEVLAGGRVRALVNMMGRATPIEVKASDLRAA